MAVLLLASFLLDLAAGDPRFLPHPVVASGRLIAWGETLAARARPGAGQRAAGAALALLVTGMSGSAVFLLLLLARRWGHPYYLAVQIYFLYTAQATRGLAAAALRVRRALARGDLPAARRLVGEVVGRDTGALDASGVSRATVETVAENTVDAVVAPLFYGFLGGAPLAMAYRAVNTLDAMVGYKNERYRYLGWASARLDDLANYLPARLGGLLLTLAAVTMGRGARAFATMAAFGGRHPSPNSGVPEAAVAGALGVRLGGPVSYGGRVVEHPYLGDAAADPGPQHIGAAVRLMVLAAVLSLVLGFLLARLWPWLCWQPVFHAVTL